MSEQSAAAADSGVFRAGDYVLHTPSGEKWVLACDEDRGEVIACGWPETFAKASDCELVAAASDGGRLQTLRQVAHSCCGQSRGHRALAQLALVENPPCTDCVLVGDDEPAVRRLEHAALCAMHWRKAVAVAQENAEKARAALERLLNAEKIEATVVE